MRYLKRLVLSGSFALSTFLSFGQGVGDGANVMIDYADGSFFVGRIISATQNSLQVRISTGDTINVQVPLIKKMVSAEDHLLKRQGRYHFKTGFFGLLSAAIGASSFDASAQFEIMGGYRWNERTSFGLGTSSEFHDLTIGNSFTTFNYRPIYGYGRYYLNNQKWRLFMDTKLGYAFALDTDLSEGHKGGLYFQPALGFHLANRHKVKPIFSLSYLLLNTQGTSVDFSTFTSTPALHDFNVWYSRIIFKVAIEIM